jgi:hypothetical protein
LKSTTRRMFVPEFSALQLFAVCPQKVRTTGDNGHYRK